MTNNIVELRPGVSTSVELDRLTAEAVEALERSIQQAVVDNDPMVGHFSALLLAIRAQREMLNGMIASVTDSRLISPGQFKVLRFGVHQEMRDALGTWRLEFFGVMKLKLWLLAAGMVIGSLALGVLGDYLFWLGRGS